MGTLDTRIDSASPFRTEQARLLRYLARPANERPEAPTPGELAKRYAPQVCSAARNVWRDRMVNEHRSSAVFASLVPQLIEASSSLDAQSTALRMALDEIHHAILCGEIVAAFGGDPVAETPDALLKMPEHPDVCARERVMRNAMFVGCLSETVAVALVTAERDLATDPLVRATLDQILGDEVMHARFGWLFLAQTLPTLDDGARDRTAAYLRVAFGYLERKELPLLPLDPPSLKGEIREQRACVGLCDGGDARELFYATVREAIVPRFEELGIPATRAWEERRPA